MLLSDVNGGTTFYWTINGATLEMALVGPSRGWMAVGFSASSSNAMIGNGAGSEIIMGYVKSGTCAAGCIADYGETQTTYPPDSGSPSKNTASQTVLVNGELAEPSGIMTLEFDRPLATTLINPMQPTVVLWAYNPSASAVTSDTVFEKHPGNARGTVSILFSSTGAQVNPAIGSGAVEVQGSFAEPGGVWSAVWTTNTALKTVRVTVTIAAGGDVYGAIGWNTQNSMVGADIVVGMVSAGGDVTVTDRKAAGHFQPGLDASQDLTDVVGSRDGSKSVFSFTRRLDTGDADDLNLGDGSVFLLYAYGPSFPASGDFSQHSVRGVVAGVSFGSDCVDYGARSGSGVTGSLTAYVPIHGVLMTLAFGCLAPMATVAAAGRFGWRGWFHIHLIAHVVGLAASVAGFALIFVAKSGVLTVDVHQILGIIVFAGFFLQSALGLLAHFMWEPARAKVPIFPDIVHHWIGRLLTLASIVTLFLGVWTLQRLYGLPTVAAPYALMGIMVAVPLVAYFVLKFRELSLKGSSATAAGYNLGDEDDVTSSSSSAPTDSLAKRVILACAFVSLLLFAGFVVTLYVPQYAYGGPATLSAVTLSSDSKGCFGFSGVQVPAVPTSYICRGFQFPNDPPQFAYDFEPQVDNSAVTHHMILYRIQESAYQSFFGGTSSQSTAGLTSEQVAAGLRNCASMPPGSSPLVAWAVGAEGLRAPSNTAFESASFFALQIHYDNPGQVTGLVDSSGFKISFTPTQRPTTSRYLRVGILQSSISLPPGQTTHLTYTCPVGNVLPAGGSAIVWTAGLHAHTRARKIWVDHIRNSNVIGFVGCENIYDFNRQRFELRNATILPGDALKIHCQYDTTGDSATITGGDASDEEMCLSYIGFYPLGFAVDGDQGCLGTATVEPPVPTSGTPTCT